MIPELESTTGLVIPIGEQIRALRKAKKMSTANLAVAIGKSAGFVNNIEKGRSEVSVTILKRVGDVLGVNISWFFQGFNSVTPDEAGLVVRQDNRRTLSLSQAGITEELLSPTVDAESQLLMTTIAPGASTGEAPITTDGEMTGVVLSGSLQLTIGERQFLLHAGDSFVVPKGVPHHSFNPGEEESRSIWSTTPPVF